MTTVAVAYSPATQSPSTSNDGLRNVYGRGMNSRSDLYKLPADRREMDRLSLQHNIWKLMFRDLYPTDAEEHVSKALQVREMGHRQPAVLDIGSGSGIWAVEMANKFPHARVIGIDLALSRPGYVPPNCSFYVADASKDLEGYEGHFDVIHCRSVAGHVSDPLALTHTIGRCLKPGGIFLSADANRSVYTQDRQLYPQADLPVGSSNVGKSWFSRWMWEVTERWTSKGHRNTEGDKLGGLIREDGQMRVLGQRGYWSPINWDGEDVPDGREIGQLMVMNATDFLQASKNALLAGDFPENTVEGWVENVQGELTEPNMRMMMKWVGVWAVKKADR